MAGFCLMPEAVNRFKSGLRTGAIDPAKLSDMSSEERNKFFESYVGKENAKDVNALFESKLLLKNQQQGMITWAKTVAGLKPNVRRDMISKISKLDRVLDPEDKKAFLKDLASTKLGVNVTQDEAKNIAELSKNIEKAKESMEKGGDRLAWGRAKVALSNYVNELKVSGQKFTARELLNPAKITSRIASNSKAINASMDNSAIFRQGWKTMWTNPGIWSKNAKSSFSNLVKQFGGKEVMDEVHADIVSRPNYDKMVRAKLAVGNLEEAFPTTAPEKIPVIGRAYKASEAAYTAFVQKTRADVFDKYLQIAEKSGVDVNNDKELQAIGKLVNSLTGRGNLGAAEPIGNTVNNVFFSPRFLKSNLDTLTAHQLQKGVTPFVRKQAAKNLVKIVSGTAAIFAVANAIKPGSVELDPRSSDFGKIKAGDTRFDVTGGAGSIVTLAARIASVSSKSTTTGQITPLNSGKYGSKTVWDVFTDFFSNKLSPLPGVARDFAKGKNPSGEKSTVGGEIGTLFTPIGIQNFKETSKDPHGANVLLTSILDGLGISANTYGTPKQGSEWKTSTSKEIAQFKQKVGDTRFNKASDEYSSRYNSWLDSIKSNPAYTKLPASEQQSVITKEKSKIQSDIFKDNGFKYKRAKSEPNKYKSLLK